MRTPTLPDLLSFNGGYVDTAGFLALQGLFAAHVTGNFVTLGSTVATGGGGALPKLLALPVFCVVVFLTRLAGLALARRGWPMIKPLVLVKLLLLVAAAIFSVLHGPFTEPASVATLAMGMTLVAAMAIQNAVHRAHLTKAPPSTLMTGTTTQIMLDLADLVAGAGGGSAVTTRLARFATAVVVFAAGCAAAAFAFVLSPVWCFALPPVVAALAFLAPTGEG